MNKGHAYLQCLSMQCGTNSLLCVQLQCVGVHYLVADQVILIPYVNQSMPFHQHCTNSIDMETGRVLPRVPAIPCWELDAVATEIITITIPPKM
eukprot:1483341-Amphidinium_carterae.1